MNLKRTRGSQKNIYVRECNFIGEIPSDPPVIKFNELIKIRDVIGRTILRRNTLLILIKNNLKKNK